MNIENLWKKTGIQSPSRYRQMKFVIIRSLENQV